LSKAMPTSELYDWNLSPPCSGHVSPRRTLGTQRCRSTFRLPTKWRPTAKWQELRRRHGVEESAGRGCGRAALAGGHARCTIPAALIVICRRQPELESTLQIFDGPSHVAAGSLISDHLVADCYVSRCSVAEHCRDGAPSDTNGVRDRWTPCLFAQPCSGPVATRPHRRTQWIGTRPCLAVCISVRTLAGDGHSRPRPVLRQAYLQPSSRDPPAPIVHRHSL